MHHPLVDDITRAYERLELPADPGLALVSYSAEPGSASEGTLGELANWAATQDRLTGTGVDR